MSENLWIPLIQRGRRNGRVRSERTGIWVQTPVDTALFVSRKCIRKRSARTVSFRPYMLKLCMNMLAIVCMNGNPMCWIRLRSGCLKKNSGVERKDSVWRNSTKAATGWPVGVPEVHQIMTITDIDYGAIFPWTQTHKKSYWIRYQWYNQQKCINSTLSALDASRHSYVPPLPWPCRIDLF